MRSLLVWLVSPVVVSLAFWSCFGWCVAAAPIAGPPVAQIVVDWDPLACGPPHRVVLELAAGAGPPARRTAPCANGGVTLDDVPPGSYRGRLYAAREGEPVRSAVPLELDVDAAIVRRHVATPR